MVTFIGNYTSKLDDKGRLVFPSPLKNMLPPDGDMRFVVKKSLYDSCLEMYTYEEWTNQATRIKESLDFFNPAHVSFFRQFMRDCVIVEPDSKVGRISIPGALLGAIGTNKEVVFFGDDFKIEIWAKEKFEASSISNEEYVAIAQSLSKR